MATVTLDARAMLTTAVVLTTTVVRMFSCSLLQTL